MRRTTLAFAAAVAAAALAPAAPASATHCDRYPGPVATVCRNTIPERCVWTEHGIVCYYS